MLSFQNIVAGGFGRLVRSCFAAGLALFLIESASQAQVSLNVTNYGAVGDAVRLLVSTTSNSPMVSVIGTNRFSVADIGKVIEVFGCRKGSWTWITNNEDTICIITNVTQGTNLWGTMLQTVSTNGALCIVGHNNATNINNCFAAAQAMIPGISTNVIVNIPAGTYLMANPTNVMNPDWVPNNYANTYPIVHFTTGGLTLAGEGTNSVLMGVGAAVSRTDATGRINFFRGSLFWVGLVTTNTQYPLIFRDLVMDGGIPHADRLNNSQLTTHWDVTHDAMVLYGISPQFIQLTLFTNCVFQHWCGEMVKNISGTDGTNVQQVYDHCVFNDGSGSGMATSHAHQVRYCRFINLRLQDEWYANCASLPSVIEFNTNFNGGPIAITGAVTNIVQQPMLIQSNYLDGGGVWFGNGENVTIRGNVFTNGALYVMFQGNTQPSDGTQAANSNIVVYANTFYGSPGVYFTGQPVINAWFTNNTGLNATIPGLSDFPQGTGGPKTNIVFLNNISSVPVYCGPGHYSYLDSRNVGTGTYFVDRNSGFIGQKDFDNAGNTNILSYGLGAYRNITATKPASIWYLDDSKPQFMPVNATMVVSNSTGSSLSIYQSTSLTGDQVVIKNATVAKFNWNSSTKSWVYSLLPPANIHLQ